MIEAERFKCEPSPRSKFRAVDVFLPERRIGSTLAVYEGEVELAVEICKPIV